MCICARVLVVCGLIVLAAFPAAGQLALGSIGGSVTYGSNAAALSGTVAYFDLRSGVFTPVVTSSDPACPANTVRITATDAFAANRKALVAITANTGPASPPSCGTPDGLIVDDTKLVHTAQDAGPVLYFTSLVDAVMSTDPLPPLTQIRWAVAGSTSQDSQCTGNPRPRGGLLVEHGRPGGCVVPKNATIAPRQAAGLDVTGTVLILVMISGSENAGEGLRLLDFANLMIGLGAYNAVNFDGGGSAAFIWSPGNAPYQPHESELLLRMMSNAQMPAGIPNDTLLQFEVNRLDPTTGHDYCAQSPCRQVYASFGLALTPPFPAAERR